MKRIKHVFITSFMMLLCFTKAKAQNEPARIVNIINFIRLLEPRDSAITKTVLYETVSNQVQLVNQYKLPATFLLQYDALIDIRYQHLLKDSLQYGSEVGAWWEITQPQVEAAGLKWRGRFPWDWHANVGFSTGYTPQERALLTDAYMEKFKSVFGKYPAAVGSWFIDAYTLGYMYDKYHITASCNVKDQVGTDGYTIWGGYWNNAFYPSRINAYMPAQNADRQIPVPIFRMLGSDPIYQYDNALGAQAQHVISLEPVYKESGADAAWVDYFFKSAFKDPCLNFSYAQAGQENSFTWDLMKDGLLMQVAKLDSLKKADVIRIETLSESAAWFKKKFPVTPPSVVSALTDYKNEGHKTLWYNSRFYRANMLWEDSLLRFRDVHLFNEAFEGTYYNKVGTSAKVEYYTFPLVDGFLWSDTNVLAGLRLKYISGQGSTDIIFDGNPALKAVDSTSFEAVCNLKDKTGRFIITLKEDRFEILAEGNNQKPWRLELTAAPGAQLPFTSISSNRAEAMLDDFRYSITCSQGKLTSVKGQDKFILYFEPVHNRIEIICRQ